MFSDFICLAAWARRIRWGGGRGGGGGVGLRFRSPLAAAFPANKVIYLLIVPVVLCISLDQSRRIISKCPHFARVQF